MTTFLILCAVMIAAALALLLYPLLRSDPATPPKGKGTPASPRAVPVAVVLMVLLPLGASAFYGKVTNFPWQNPQAVAATGQGGHAQRAGSMDEATAQLEARLQKSPGDAEGWRMLGRTYLVTGRAGDAVRAYERASALTGGNNPDVELDLAEAIVLADQPDAQDRAKAIIDAALATDGNNQKALWYSGLLALRAEDLDTTRTQWTKLLDMNPPEDIRQILVSQLQALGVEVEGESAAAGPSMGATTAGMGEMAGMTAATDSGPGGREIRVALSLDPGLAGRLQPGTTLFVSAREPGIPGPPLAAVRLTTDALPTTVVLSDANAMVEGRNLSSVNDVQVVARVAFGGTAVTASGDLIGESIHRKGDAPDVSVVIDTVTP